MRSLMRYARQLGQRRTIAFYLSPQAGSGRQDQLQHHFDGYAKAEDRPRSLREMFPDLEYDREDEPVDDMGLNND